MAEYIGWKSSLTAALGKIGETLAVRQVALTSNLIYTIPEGTPSGIVHRVVFTQDGTGGHTVTYGGAPVEVATAAGASTTVEFWPNGEVAYPVAAPLSSTFAAGIALPRALGGGADDTPAKHDNLGRVHARHATQQHAMATMRLLKKIGAGLH